MCETTTTTRRLTQACPFSCGDLHRKTQAVDMDVDRATGAAWRRRQHRLRSWWRHEQQTVAAVLATLQHQCPTGTEDGQDRGGAREELHAALRKMPPPQAAGAQHFAMDAGEDVGEAPAAGRPAPLLKVLPQERVQQRTVEQIVDPLPSVPLLQVFVPQMVEQLVDIFYLSISALPSRLSKCPRSCVHPALLAQSSVRRRRQNSWWKCRRLSSVLPCCSRLWSRTLTIQFLLVVEGETQIFKVFSVDRVQQCRFCLWNAFLSRLWSRLSTFLFLLEALKIFAQDRVHPQLRTLQLLGSTLRMSRFKGFFALFPRKKKVRLTPGTWCESARHISSSTSSAYGPRTWGGRRHG